LFFSEIDGDLFVAQALSFLLAGYETSASTLTFALYELALHPEIQQSLRAEILQVLSKHDGKLTYDGIQNMSYLDRVVSGEERRYNLRLIAGLVEVNFEVKKIPRILNSQFPRKGRTPDIKYTGIIQTMYFVATACVRRPQTVIIVRCYKRCL